MLLYRRCTNMAISKFNASNRQLHGPLMSRKDLSISPYLICQVNRLHSEPGHDKASSVVSSIQPLAGLHLGIYFGSMKPCVELQNSGHSVYLCIADVLAFTSVHCKDTLRQNILQVAATLLACGLNPQQTVLLQQSRVVQHAQLDWILHSLISKDDVQSVPSHSVKLAAVKDITVGQYVSPVLQCADVLLYRAGKVPSGADFKEQLDMICRTASLFNQKYGECFPQPSPVINDDFSSCIRSFRKPLEKMSRSEADPRSRIELLDSPETIVEKCKKSVTDFTSQVYFDAVNRPGVSNLMALHSLTTGKSLDQISRENVSKETAQYKFAVADALVEYLTPIRNKTKELLQERTTLLDILEQGSARARLKAEDTIQLVHDKIGFGASTGLHRHSGINVTLQTNSSISSTSSPTKRKYIFSGIQPTGVLHLGNYFGAVKQWVDQQSLGHDVMVCVVDQHAITVPQQRDILHNNILAMAASIMACGVDPDRSIVFQQSRVPHHAQLNTLLRSVTHVALLARQAHYKDKIASLKEVVPSLGLFSYPVLQAADILLYKASHVPVGDDQRQHIQVAKQIARQFNNRCGAKIFRLPTAMILDDSLARLKSLQQPHKKMSKSEADADSRIEILDTPESIVRKCKNAVTGLASTEVWCGDPKVIADPGIANLMAMHQIVTSSSVEDIHKEAAGLDVDSYKMLVAEAVVEHLRPMRARADQLLADRSSLLAILDGGAERARHRAESTLQAVHDSVGFVLH